MYSALSNGCSRTDTPPSRRGTRERALLVQITYRQPRRRRTAWTIPVTSKTRAKRAAMAVTKFHGVTEERDTATPNPSTTTPQNHGQTENSRSTSPKLPLTPAFDKCSASRPKHLSRHGDNENGDQEDRHTNQDDRLAAGDTGSKSGFFSAVRANHCVDLDGFRAVITRLRGRFRRTLCSLPFTNPCPTASSPQRGHLMCRSSSTVGRPSTTVTSQRAGSRARCGGMVCPPKFPQRTC